MNPKQLIAFILSYKGILIQFTAKIVDETPSKGIFFKTYRYYKVILVIANYNSIKLQSIKMEHLPCKIQAPQIQAGKTKSLLPSFPAPLLVY